MKKVIFIAITVIIFHSPATYAAEWSNTREEGVSIHTHKYENSAGWCRVRHNLKEHTIEILVRDNNLNLNQHIVIQKNTWVQRKHMWITKTSKTWRGDRLDSRTEGPVDLFYLACREPAKNLPKEVRSLFGGHWGIK